VRRLWGDRTQEKEGKKRTLLVGGGGGKCRERLENGGDGPGGKKRHLGPTVGRNLVEEVKKKKERSCQPGSTSLPWRRWEKTLTASVG